MLVISAYLENQSDMNLGFCASTGRSGTTLLASVLDSLPNIKSTHEGYDGSTHEVPQLPLINIQNRRAWRDKHYAMGLVRERRSPSIMRNVSGDAALFVDVAFYNAPIMHALQATHPHARLLIIFRKCESFVRSATVRSSEDLMPAGWADPDKKLTPREQFIALGRLKPEKGTADEADWDLWSAVRRNIWLWHAVNSHLCSFLENNKKCTALFYEDLCERPVRFWTDCLTGLGVYSEENIRLCLKGSEWKVNRRLHYDVCEYSSWTYAEQKAFSELSLPLETQIYDRRTSR